MTAQLNSFVNFFSVFDQSYSKDTGDTLLTGKFF